MWGDMSVAISPSVCVHCLVITQFVAVKASCSYTHTRITYLHANECVYQLTGIWEVPFCGELILSVNHVSAIVCSQPYATHACTLYNPEQTPAKCNWADY